MLFEIHVRKEEREKIPPIKCHRADNYKIDTLINWRINLTLAAKHLAFFQSKFWINNNYDTLQGLSID